MTTQTTRDEQPAICAATGTPNRYGVAWAHSAGSSWLVQCQAYHGVGNSSITARPTACGGLGIAHAGALALGETFTLTIDNLSGAATYVLSVDTGSVTRSGSVVTVTGLAPGATATVVVTARVTGETDASASLAGAALAAGVVPAWGAPVATVDGFTVELSNFDPDRDYVVTVAPAGTVVMSGATVTVTGLGVGEEATVTILSRKDGEADVSTDIPGRAIALGTVPMLSAPKATQNGFTFSIVNYDAAVTYVLTPSGGAVASRSGATVTVRGLAPLGGSTVKVDATRSGYTATTASIAGSAAPVPPPAPAPSAPSVSTEPTAPDVEHLEPGSSAGRIGDRSITPDVTVGADGGVVLDFGGSTMTVTALVDDKPAPTGPDGLVIVNRGGEVFVEVTGFAPGSDLETWIFSTARHISTSTVSGEGMASQSSRIPSDLDLGAHTLAVTGTDAAGELITMTLGLLVIDDETSITDTVGDAQGLRSADIDTVVPPVETGGTDGSGWVVTLLWLLLLVPAAMLFIIILVRRRRRRDEESTTAA